MRKVIATLDDAEALNNEAYSEADRLFQASRYREARKLFEVAASANPDDGWAHLAIGNCWDALRKPKRAAQSFQAALERLPEAEKPGALYNLANALFDQGLYHEAANLYRHVPRSTPTWELARKNLMLALACAGDES